MKTTKALAITAGILLILCMIGYAGCGSDDGACIIDGLGCTDTNEGMCNTLNGDTFYPDSSCADLGYTGD